MNGVSVVEGGGGGGGVMAVTLIERILTYPPLGRLLTVISLSQLPALSSAVMCVSLGIDPVITSPPGVDRILVVSRVTPETIVMVCPLNDENGFASL